MNEPHKTAQWINPVFYNNDFENELNFPLWFDDSLVKAHNIYKITKRIYGRIEGDTAEVNSYKQAIPKEKIEYYFDPNGFVDQLVVYSYFDDREISRATFVYEGNLYSSGYRKVKALPFISLTKKPIKDEFTTDLFQDKTHQFSFMTYVFRKRKFMAFLDVEKGNHLFVVKSKKNWGPLSIDSIVSPKKEDWIIHGSIKKPKKRYKVENIVNESMVHTYTYWKSGMIKQRIRQDYPFEQRRTYLYGKKHQWTAYIDSTFSEGVFVSRKYHQIRYDEYDRPMEIIHLNKNEQFQHASRETLHYRTRNKLINK